MKKGIVASLAALGLSLAVVGIAVAAGGKTISTAPIVSFGAQQFGNTSEGAEIRYSMVEYWKVPLIAGDRLTIKFKQGAPEHGVDWLYLYEVGTDDFNVGGARSESTGISANGFGQFDFDAPRSGIYPLAVSVRYTRGGAYDFTATVKHHVRLGLDARQVSARGTVRVTARYPDGTSVTSGLGGTLYGLWGGKWNKLGQATAKTGTISVRYKLPAALRGKTLKLRMTTGGPSFFPSRITKTVSIR